MMSRLRRARLAALVLAAWLVAACAGSQTASDRPNPGGQSAGANKEQGVSAGTGGGAAKAATAGALGTVIPTPGQTGTGAGVKPAVSPSPNPSPSPGGS